MRSCLSRGMCSQRPHVVQAVGQLDQDDADVAGHRQQHLAEVLRLALLAGVPGDLTQLGHPLDQHLDLAAEQAADVLGGGAGVLDAVVQQARRRPRRRPGAGRRSAGPPPAGGRRRARPNGAAGRRGARPRTRSSGGPAPGPRPDRGGEQRREPGPTSVDEHLQCLILPDRRSVTASGPPGDLGQQRLGVALGARCARSGRRRRSTPARRRPSRDRRSPPGSRTRA